MYLAWLLLSILYLHVRTAGSFSSSNSTLLVVPGMSPQSNRTLTVLQNLHLLRSHSSDFSCLIHYYSSLAVARSEFEQYNCQIQFFDERNHYADYLKSIVPSLLAYAQFRYVMILLDDVELLPTFRLKGILEIMQRNNLSVISPGIHGSTMTSTLPYKHSPHAKRFKMPPLYTLGTTVHSIEIFATIFTLESWKCFWDMIEPRWNAAGWGYDLCFYNFCRNEIPHLNMGVVFSMSARHHNDYGKVHRNLTTHTQRADVSEKHPGLQYNLWVKEMKDKRNITMIPVHKHSRGKKLI